MFFAISFDIVRDIGIAIIAEMRIVVKISGSERFVGFVICETVNAAPVLDFWNKIRVRKEIDMTIVFMEPKRIRNCSRVCFPVIWDPIIAAWDEPRPGKKEQIGEIRIVARGGFRISFLFSFSVFKDCFGRTVFDFIEWMMVEVAKSPVRSGRSGFWIFIFREASPRNPANMNIMVAFIFEFFSVEIKKIAIQIKRIPIMRSKSG